MSGGDLTHELAAIGREMHPVERLVVRGMATCNDDFRPYVRTIASDIGLPVEQLRRTLRRLAELGLVTYGPVSNMDTGAPAGSTWWLTERGTALQEVLGK